METSLFIHNSDDHFIHDWLHQLVQMLIYLSGPGLWISTSRGFSGKSSFPILVPRFWKIHLACTLGQACKSRKTTATTSSISSHCHVKCVCTSRQRFVDTFPETIHLFTSSCKLWVIYKEGQHPHESHLFSGKWIFLSECVCVGFYACSVNTHGCPLVMCEALCVMFYIEKVLYK